MDVEKSTQLTKTYPGIIDFPDLGNVQTLRENYEFEAKAAQGRDGNGELPRSFWETYSSLANTDGGFVALGLEENPDHSFKCLGIGNPEKLLKELWDNLNNKQKV